MLRVTPSPGQPGAKRGLTQPGVGLQHEISPVRGTQELVDNLEQPAATGEMRQVQLGHQPIGVLADVFQPLVFADVNIATDIAGENESGNVTAGCDAARAACRS
jgi:hypothetical protein